MHPLLAGKISAQKLFNTSGSPLVRSSSISFNFDLRSKV
jgi:hypothetical protein